MYLTTKRLLPDDPAEPARSRGFRYPSDMRIPIVGLVGLCLMAVACAGSPASLGSQFADAYAAFAPLYAVYRAYAEYLFSGTAVEVPGGLVDSCERFSYELARFHVDYVLQTESATAGGLGYVIRLRAESSAFCGTYEETIGSVISTRGDEEVLEAASDEGFFAEIKGLNDLMEAALDEILAGMGEGVERWAFAVAFSIRTVLNQPEIVRIDPNLREILYADAEGTAPPFQVPAEIGTAMERLLDLAGRELTEEEGRAAAQSAGAIYEYFIAQS